MRKKLSNFFSQRGVVLIFLVLVAFILRLYKINDPIADWHSFRQSDTASVAWEYYTAMRWSARTPGSSFSCGFACLDLLRPQYQDLSDIQSGQDNPDGWRMVEFPIISALVASIMYLSGSDQIELIYRVVDIGFSLLSVVGIYLLVRRLSGRKLTASLAALILAILPYSVFYSRTILPEVPLITGQIWTLFFLVRLLRARQQRAKLAWWLATTVTLVLTLLIKPMAVFLLPVLIYLVWRAQGWRALKNWSWYLLALVAVGVLLGWRKWIGNFPSGVPKNDWLLQGQVRALSLTWWRWLGVERLVKIMLGIFGSALAPAVIFCGAKNHSRGQNRYDTTWLGFVTAYLLGSTLFLLVFASGNVQHDYYQNFILPSLAIALASSLTLLIDCARAIKKWRWSLAVIGALAACVVQLFYFFISNNTNQINLGQTLGWRLVILLVLWLAIFGGWWLFLRTKNLQLETFLIAFLITGTTTGLMPLALRVADFYHVNNWAIVAAGKKAQKILPLHTRVIAPYGGDTAFLWQTRRRGWPLGFAIDEKIAAGAGAYVTVNFDDEAKTLVAQYLILAQTDDYLILDLTKSATESALP